MYKAYDFGEKISPIKQLLKITGKVSLRFLGTLFYFFNSTLSALDPIRL